MVLKMFEPINALRSQWKNSRVQGKSDEPIVVVRAEKSNTQMNYNLVRKGIIKRNSSRELGDTIDVEGIKYFVVGKQSTELKLMEQNAHINIVKLVSKYVGSNKVGDQEQSVSTNVPTVQYDVSGNMKLYDLGLLSTTIKKFILPICDIQVNYRIKFSGKIIK